MTDRHSQAAAPRLIHRADYAPPAFLVDHVDLSVALHDDRAEIATVLALRANPAALPGQPLRLDGEDLTTNSVILDGRVLGQDEVLFAEGSLVIDKVPQGAFLLTTHVVINPYDNKALQGLYLSGGMLCTQCEAEGFRRITWYPDRPDVMARFRVSIAADKARFPVLLSNGNQVKAVDLDNGRHRVVWEDPFPKPSYLFALVAGDLALVDGTFTTRSGRAVALKFWVEHGNEDQVDHALVSLKKAMEWDERVFGLEYDLDIYNVVAVSHFNMGAMENKSLNVFNSKYVLAKRETATDGDFLGIESVIAHEYFHNWTGNRVTCRDWFQLTLKEGLTVFRDQEFSADMNSRALKRIEDVRILRGGQFPEDNGPMAHPIRPDSYVEINNFYTATVYNKGAEVIRMIHTLIGPENFRKGMDLYFQRHDGQAVTCEDFICAMEDAAGRDLGQFRRWYEQAGTPRVTAEWVWDKDSRSLTLTLSQNAANPGRPFHIPMRLGLVGKQGDIALRLRGENEASGTSRILDVTEDRQSFVFEDVAEKVVPSLFREFSAPVILDAPYGLEDMAFLMGRDSDPFNRWEAGQQLAARILLDLVDARAAGQTLRLDPVFAEAWGRVLADAAHDPAFAAEALTLPSLGTLGEMMDVVDIDGIHAARNFVLASLGTLYVQPLLALKAGLGDMDYTLTPEAIGKRRLGNQVLFLLAKSGHGEALAMAQAQFRDASCMTDQLASLGVLSELGPKAADPALDAFYGQWKSENLVVNKWLGLQAAADWPDVLDRVKALQAHPAFDASEPNKIYALIGGFTGNAVHFHALDGSGYGFLADQVIALDGSNPQIASRMVRALIRWKRFDATRRDLMKAELERIGARENLSRDTGEIVTRALA